MNQHIEGFIDWNLVLNEEGGPNHVCNFCDAPILIDRKAGQVTYNGSYFYIGHFSKYIKPGAYRIHSIHNLGDQLSTASYLNLDHTIAKVLFNESDHDQQVNLVVGGQGVTLKLVSYAIQTVILSA